MQAVPRVVLCQNGATKAGFVSPNRCEQGRRGFGRFRPFRRPEWLLM